MDALNHKARSTFPPPRAPLSRDRDPIKIEMQLEGGASICGVTQNLHSGAEKSELKSRFFFGVCRPVSIVTLNKDV